MRATWRGDDLRLDEMPLYVTEPGRPPLRLAGYLTGWATIDESGEVRAIALDADKIGQGPHRPHPTSDLFAMIAASVRIHYAEVLAEWIADMREPCDIAAFKAARDYHFGGAR